MPPRNKAAALAATQNSAPAVHTSASATKKAKRLVEAAAKKAAEAPKGFDEKPVTQPSRTGQTVTIGCKIPMGIKLEFHNWHEVSQNVVGGGVRMAKEARVDPTVKPIFLRGWRIPFGHIPDFRIVNRTAFTAGVPAELWTRWCKDNSQHPALLNRQIYAASTEDAAIGMAKEYKDEESGMQAMKPDTDKRIPKRRNRKGQMTNDPAILSNVSDED